MALVPIFVLAGQSNAEFSGIDNRMFEIASAQGSGFEMVKVAWRATSLFADPARADWDPASGELYADLVAGVLAAEERVRAAGDTPVVATLWVQGESDVSRGSAYGPALEDFIVHYRADIGQPDSWFSISLLPTSGAVRSAQLAAAADLAQVGTIETHGAGTEDGIHYDKPARDAIAVAFMMQAGLALPGDAAWINDQSAAQVTERPYAVSVLAAPFADMAWHSPGEARPVYLTSYSGDDTIMTGTGDDIIATGGNNDLVRSGPGNDRIGLDRGNDVAYGGAGNDQIMGDSGNDRLYGGTGDDVLEGGLGRDFLSGGSGEDTASYARAPGSVRVNLALTGFQRTGAEGVDRLISIEDLIGSGFGDVLTGSEGANRIEGGGGDDRLTGRGGDDVLVGGAGSDLIEGGAGADRFVFANATDGTADTIVDFSQDDGDRIDLSAIDAGPTTSADDAFTFIDTAAFGAHPGEVRFEQRDTATRVEADVDGDGMADLIVDLTGSVALGATDFVL